MNDWKTYFKGKKITVMGLGLLGRGVGDIRFLAEHGAELIVTDLKSEEELAPSREALSNFPDIVYRFEKKHLENLDDFSGRDLILMAPGTPSNSPHIAEARKNNIPITMSTALFARFAKEMGVTIVGVTGTRGKTTTTHMIEAILRAAGKKVLLGGNVRGVSTLALLPEVTQDSIVVLELDSWQLQGFREEQISPDVAVFTTFYPDHLNYYHGDMEAYFADKAEIFKWQKPGDILVVGSEVEARVRNFGTTWAIKSELRQAHLLPSDWKLSIPGIHNRQNADCARLASLALGIDELIIKTTLESFLGVPGRLELVREVEGVKFYNDTTATTPEATLAGLIALEHEKHLALIMGGSDKGLDMSKLVGPARNIADMIIFLDGSGTKKIQKLLDKRSIVTDSLSEAVKTAFEYLKSQGEGTVLFSPAFASFGMFKNEYDRGDQFVALVTQLGSSQ